MANRDIQLIIKAKNLASKNIDEVNSALSALTAAQNNVSSSAKKTDGAIANLSGELERLKNGTKAVEGLNKAKSIMETAEQAVARLGVELNEARAKLDAAGVAASTAAARLEELSAANALLRTRQQQQQADMEAARKGTIKTSDAVKELTKAERAYASAIKLKPETKGRDDTIAQAKARLDAATAAVQRNTDAYGKQKARLGEIAQELKRNAQETAAVKKAQREAQVETEKLNASVEAQVATLNKAQGEYAQIVTKVETAAAAIDKLGIKSADTSMDAGKLTAQIERLGAVMQGLMRYSGGSGQFVDPKTAAKMRDLRTQADAVKASWEALESEAKRLAVEIRNTSGNVTELTNRQLEAARAAKAAKGEYGALTAELHKVSGAGQTLPPMFNNIASGANRAAGSKRGLKRDTDGAADAMGRLGHASDKAKVGLLGVNRESRQAMSVMQRVRGEVLSLATSYLGLFGAIQGVGGVLTAFQQMEAAQNRLGVVFEQNGTKVRTEMDWLMAQASRLGIQFGTLSDQYSKFAVAADAAGFSTGETRDVFMALAEAGRVNKLSLEDMNGAFLALTQMISKGKISSEELRQQLGERLPGAMNIMADALDVTTGELYKMLEQGEVLADSKTMLKFADELNRRFGPQLASSLQSTSAEIGKFWNNVFQAQLQVANGGFIEGFNNMLAEMNKWFQSEDGHKFFLALGAAAGRVADAMTFVVRNIELFGYGLQFLVAIKAAAWLVGIVSHLAEVRANLATTTAQTTITTASFTALWGKVVALSATMRAQFVGAVAMAGGALTGFNIKLTMARAGSLALSAGLVVVNGAIRALNIAMAAMGGPLGLLITLASLVATPLIVGWATGVDGATAALDEHQRIMQAILGQYDRVKGKTEAWGDSIENVSLDQVNANLRKMAEAYAKARDMAAGDAASTTTLNLSWVGGFEAEARKYTKALQNLGERFRDSKITAREYREELERLYRETDSQDIQVYIEGLLENARAAEKAADNYGIAAEIADKFGSTLGIVAEGLGLTTTRLEDTAEAQDETNTDFDEGTKSLDAYAEAMGRLAEKVPALGAELKKLSDLAKIEADFQAAIGAIDGRLRSAGQLYADAAARRDAAISATEQTYMNSMLGGSLVDRIIGVESGGNANAKNPDSSATGLGQFIESTWLSLFKKHFPDSASGLTDAAILELRKDADVSRKMVEIYLRENAESLKAAGLEINDANLYLSHFLGAGGAKALLSSAPGTIANDVLGADQINANASILDGKTREEVIAWAQRKVGISRTDLELQEATVEALRKQREEAERRDEDREEQRLANEQALADMGFENEMLQTRMAGKEKEAFIEEQIRALRGQTNTLAAEQEARARELLARQYDLNAAIDAEKNKKTEIEQIEQRITDLQTQRDALKEQRDFYEESGDTSKVTDLDGQIVGINSELSSAIQSAIALYEVMGGSGADAAIAKMEALGLSTGKVDLGLEKTSFSAKEMSDTIFNLQEGGILNMFDAFAKAIANGENAVGALGDAFRQFAADFLMQIAKMIIQQALFNALQSMSGSIGGFISGLFHTGGIIGSSPGSGTRNVSPAWFNSAARYHTGGIAGLKPNEMPAILELGEEVLTRDDPRHARNAGVAQLGGEAKRPRIVNLFDSASFLSEALNNVLGEEVILNYVRSNPSAFKQAMEG